MTFQTTRTTSSTNVLLVISGATVGQVGVDVSVKFGILAQRVFEIYDSQAVGGGTFDRFGELR